MAIRLERFPRCQCPNKGVAIGIGTLRYNRYMSLRRPDTVPAQAFPEKKLGASVEICADAMLALVVSSFWQALTNQVHIEFHRDKHQFLGQTCVAKQSATKFFRKMMVRFH